MLQYDPYDTSYVSAPRGIEDDRTVDPDKIPRATRAIIAVSYEARALVIARPCARAREIFFAGPSERTLPLFLSLQSSSVCCVWARAGGVCVGGCACLCDAALTRAVLGRAGRG